MTTYKTNAILISLLGTLACGNAPVDRVDDRARVAADEVPEQVESPVLAAAPAPMGDDWEAWVSSEVARLLKDAPEAYNALRGLQPRDTRAGFPRFTGPLVRDPNAAPMFLDRFMSGNESVAVKAALLEALPRTGGPFGPAIVELYGREHDAKIREVMMVSLRTADAESAMAGLALGLEDSDPVVRLNAARTAARREDGAQLSAELVRAVGDADAGVKLEAMRSIGALRIDGAKDLLTGELTDGEADVRLGALRALGRIDATYVASLPQLTTLQRDADPRIVDTATKFATKR